MNPTANENLSFRSGTVPAIQVLAKPVGPLCNLDCEYCYYLEKDALFERRKSKRMSDKVLRAFIAEYVRAQPGPVVEFAWQGGEPTLLGIEFFRRVIEFQKPFAQQKTITNSLQTNGTLLDNEWCAFLRQHNFMVGLSLDGPQEIHDRYRRDRGQKGTFERVMRGLQLLQKHDVEFNVLACVSRESAKRPLEVYRFLRDQGVEFIQFIPIVERTADPESRHHGLRLAGPANLKGGDNHASVTPWSAVPEDYGDFLIAVYEEWVRRDVGTVFVMNFEWALNAWVGNPSPICIHSERCGRAVVIEHNGDVYACDHYVYPEFGIGTITSDTFAAMIAKSLQSGFGIEKETALPDECRRCEVRAACNGGCPKYRFLRTPDGKPGLQYLCAGYKKFFLHSRPYLQAMAQLMSRGLPASHIMQVIQEKEREDRAREPGE